MDVGFGGPPLPNPNNELTALALDIGVGITAPSVGAKWTCGSAVLGTGIDRDEKEVFGGGGSGEEEVELMPLGDMPRIGVATGVVDRVRDGDMKFARLLLVGITC